MGVLKQKYNELTWRKKINYLLILSLCFLVFSYLVAFKNTIQIYKQSKVMLSKVEYADNATERIGTITNRLNQINQLFNNSEINNISTQDAILEKVISVAGNYNVLLKEFPSPHVFSNEDYNIHTYIITCEGKYINLLNFVHYFEKNSSFGHVISVSFYTVRDLNTKKIKLEMKVYLQKYIRKNES